VKVAVVGAAGYTGAEAVRWVLGHPELELVMATSGADADRRIDELYPALRAMTDVVLVAPDVEAVAAQADVAILAVPHTAAMTMVPQLVHAGLTVIDLSADFRLTDPAVYEAWYATPHTAPQLLSSAVYGMPELDRSRLRGASLVAVPGCYPTASVLAALPAVAAGVWDGSPVVIDAKSGVSGAGRTPSGVTHYVAANESMNPYKVGAHRHTPEIEQALAGAAGGTAVSVLFSPHLVPLSRGMLATVYLRLAAPLDTAQAIELYRSHYASEPFVAVLDEGVMPTTAEVRGTNRAAIGVHADGRTRTLVAVCAIDNLGKGAAGQGIQCLNATAGFPETLGLDAVGPVV
jgi:N-acetyl-gamma-glutamyl-phosphate reductase